MDLAGKRALVTGGAQGIGLAIVKQLYKYGVHVTILDIQEEKLKKLSKEYKGLDVIVADLNDFGQTLKALENLPPFQLVVNNAGIRITQHIQKMSLDIMNREFNVNLKSVFAVCQHAVRELVAAGETGAIVNISSIRSARVTKGARPYDCAKAGLEQFSKCLALECAPHGIRVNSVSPGIVLTELALEVLTDSTRMAEFNNAPMKDKIADPDDIANAVIFLLSEKMASKITGANLVVDQGLMLT